jgi:XTP/dITP diphosphohydrolase
MTRLLYATTNQGKLKEMRRLAAAQGVALLSPTDLGLNIEVVEDGTTLYENAIKKAECYFPYVESDIAIIGDDTGVEIIALNGEPGIYVRRWKDHEHELSDEEVIDYCMSRMQAVPQGSRQARFHTVLAVAQQGQDTKIFDGYLDGEITNTPLVEREHGFPFWSIFYLPQLGKMLGELQQDKNYNQANFPTHRELAMKAALAALNL